MKCPEWVNPRPGADRPLLGVGGAGEVGGSCWGPTPLRAVEMFWTPERRWLQEAVNSALNAPGLLALKQSVLCSMNFTWILKTSGMRAFPFAL